MVFDGHALGALIDTGSFRTLLTLTGARRSGVSEAALEAAPRVGTVSDMSGMSIAVSVIPFDRITLGELVFRDVKMPVMASELPVEVILGLDVLLLQRVWISFATGAMHLGHGGP
jgi:predicted aspartyl protease